MSTTPKTETVTAEIMPGVSARATLLDESWTPSFNAQDAHEVRVDVEGTTWVVPADAVETR